MPLKQKPSRCTLAAHIVNSVSNNVCFQEVVYLYIGLSTDSRVYFDIVQPVLIAGFHHRGYGRIFLFMQHVSLTLV